MVNHLRRTSKDDMVSSTCPKVSIGIPVYNGEIYLRDSIRSVLCQSYNDFELLITDDGSTDDSISIIKQFNDSRIKLVVDGKNKGLPYRLNQQVKMAKGQYFIRMDADDIMFPDRVAAQIAFLETHEEVDLVGAKTIIINETNQILYQSKRGGRAPRKKTEVMNGNVFSHPTVAGKTEWFRRHPYDETKRRSQDFFLWLSSVEESNFALMDVPVLFYRVEGTGLLKRFRNDNKLMCEFYWQKLCEDYSVFFLKKWLKHIFRWPAFLVYYIVNGSEGVIRKRYSAISTEERIQYENIMQQMHN